MQEAIARGARAAVHLRLRPSRGRPCAAAQRAPRRDGARGRRCRVCGANCMGFYNDLDRVWVCGFPSPREPRPGSIAFIAHSGSVFGALAHNDPRLRFAHRDLAGPGADDHRRRLHRLRGRPAGGEGRRPFHRDRARSRRASSQALDKAARRGVPVVALKVGRTEAAAAAALTPYRRDRRQRRRLRGALRPLRRHPGRDARRARRDAAALRDRAPRGARRARLDRRFRRGARDDHRPRRPGWECRSRRSSRRRPGTAISARSSIRVLTPANPLDAWGTGSGLCR